MHIALREIVALRRFKRLMKNHAGNLEFSPRDRQRSVSIRSQLLC